MSEEFLGTAPADGESIDESVGCRHQPERNFWLRRKKFPALVRRQAPENALEAPAGPLQLADLNVLVSGVG